MSRVPNRSQRSHGPRIGDEITLVAISSIGAHVVRTHTVDRESLVEYTTNKHRRLYVPLIMLQQGQRCILPTIEHINLASQTRLPLELSWCEPTHSTLYRCFDEPKLGCSRHSGDDGVNSAQGILQRRWVIVVDNLALVPLRYQCRLMLVMVNIYI